MQTILGTFPSYHFRSVAIGGRSLRSKLVWTYEDATVNKVRSCPGYPIKNFRQLVDEVAKLTLDNTRYELFYRGQSKDYLDKKGKTVIYPTICRPEKKADGTPKPFIRTATIQARYDKLQKLIKYADKQESKFEEYHCSLFQHYGIFPTPLIDITQSLRVAASFALLKNAKSGYVYVFGLPYPHGSISHIIDHRIVLIKLQNVSPSNAYRPRYQEGYLAGKFPFRPTKEADDNLARRLIGKFKLNNKNGKFWDEHFNQIPEEVLYPTKDKYLSEAKRLEKYIITSLK